jgi:hypothetical protein
LASVDLPEPLGPISAWISPAVDGEVDAFEDRLAVGGGMEVFDLEKGGVAHG